MRVLSPWHREPRDTADTQPLKWFKARLDKTWSNPGYWKVTLPMEAVGMSWALRCLPSLLFSCP